MDKEKILEKVRSVISEQLNVAAEKIEPSTTFSKDLGADSLDVFQFVSELEDAFEIEFSNEDFERIRTVGDAVDYIHSKT